MAIPGISGCSVARLVLALTGLCGMTMGWAQSIDIELNKFESQPEACRAYMVFRNSTEQTFDAFKLDMVMFDQEGLINRRLALDVAPLRADKTSVKLFDIEGLPCEQINQILINDVIECAARGGGDPDCVTLLETSSRNATALIK